MFIDMHVTLRKSFQNAITAVLMLTLAGVSVARAQQVYDYPPIEVGPAKGELSYFTEVIVKNGSDAPVTFNRTANQCVLDAPESFTVGAGQTHSFTVEQKQWDTGLDNCYAAHHRLAYQDAAQSGNSFDIQQYNSSDQPECLGITFFIIFPVAQAICPETTGRIAKVHIYDGPKIVCPGGMPVCRAQGGRTQTFGFYVTTFKKIPNVAQYGGSGYKNKIDQRENVSAEECQDACVADDECKYVTYARIPMLLDLPGGGSFQYNARTCVMFSLEDNERPWFVSAFQADSYEKR